MSSTIQFDRQPDPGLYNPDLAPVPKEKRNWSWLNYSTIWMGMVHNIVSYELAGSLIGLGMSAWQALAVVIVSNIVLIGAIWLNSVCGAKYGLPFPVLIRAAFGYKGAHVPVLIRAFVAIFWFSVQAYAGSKAVGAVIGLIFPGWISLGTIHLLGASLNDLISFAIFWLVHAYVILHGMERIKSFELWAGPLVIVLGLGLVVWAIHAAHGLGPIFSVRATLSGGHFWGTFFLSVSGMIGVLASLVLNIPDLTRFAGSQRDQIIGQAVGLPVMMTFFAFMSVVITSGTVIAFGKPIFDPVQLLLHFKNPIVVLLGAFSLLIATVSVNVVANVVSPAYDLTNLLPRKLNFVKGGMISILIGVLFAPWAWYNNSNSILSVIGAIGGTLGPVAGIMIADFYFIHRRIYDVESLYSKEGAYTFRQGWNPQAFIAMILGIIVALIGLFVPALHALYAYNWFLGVGVGAVAYIALMRIVRGVNHSNTIIPTTNLETVSLQQDEI
ncbi:NCS1 family nucleobase:cation symporter-1 [Alicyclobacillus fastidiosus]|uniref:NCS1 family nucleobase:cation symporter-1 n=1 Tax=Alicyclobacillus fastidiosus TaxID=392011 RepID=A0ABV5ABC9_9BACL|nr:NCS1 family nucleobase:cation symporter-1 [Alicyclobacillus fastidiosus]WEH10453.1 NCS1 family nucleobase:cation symporter-1 [Alicyclobacillus fastidiosus]